ncbi:MAG: glycosyltransferase [Zoogloeaceae bacterium]|jgi:hypothetical protein|nr:glycosyltransferase [Zoogloeaceae bacterium]
MISHAIPLSVTLLTHNRLHFLREAVDSVLAQRFGDFELLILDNHSTDGTADYCVSLTDPRVRYVRNPPDMDVEFNFASALRLARGALRCLFHDDDVMEPEMLARQMAFIEDHPEVWALWCNRIHINTRGEVVSTPLHSGEDRLFAPGEYIRTFLAERLWPVQSGVMFRPIPQKDAQTILALHYFYTRQAKRARQEDYPGSGDVLCMAEFNAKHAVACLGTPLLRYRIHDEQETRGIDTEKPLIFLYSRLKPLVRKAPGAQDLAVVCEAGVLRYRAQRLLTQTRASTPRLRQSFLRLWRNFAARPELPPAALRLALPVALAAHMLGEASALEQVLSIFPEGEKTEADKATRALLAWARRRAAGEMPLAALRGRRVILFGSVFVAALLLLEAQAEGVALLACVDSNRTRQGGLLLGVPVHSVVWLASPEAAQADTLILTPEQAHENIMCDLAQRQGCALEILSWKTLVTAEAGQKKERPKTLER